MTKESAPHVQRLISSTSRFPQHTHRISEVCKECFPGNEHGTSITPTSLQTYFYHERPKLVLQYQASCHHVIKKAVVYCCVAQYLHVCLWCLLACKSLSSALSLRNCCSSLVVLSESCIRCCKTAAIRSSSSALVRASWCMCKACNAITRAITR